MFGDKEDLLVEHEEPAIALKSFKSSEPIENHFPPVVKDQQSDLLGGGPSKLNKAASLMQESESFFKGQ